MRHRAAVAQLALELLRGCLHGARRQRPVGACVQVRDGAQNRKLVAQPRQAHKPREYPHVQRQPAAAPVGAACRAAPGCGDEALHGPGGRAPGRELGDYDELWRWSVEHLEDFWASIWEFCGVRASKPYERVLASHEMPGTRWFEGAQLNYAENVLARGAGREGEVAVLHCSELRELDEITWGELSARVAAAADGLRALGVGRGDRVVA